MSVHYFDHYLILEENRRKLSETIEFMSLVCGVYDKDLETQQTAKIAFAENTKQCYSWFGWNKPYYCKRFPECSLSRQNEILEKINLRNRKIQPRLSAEEAKSLLEMALN